MTMTELNYLNDIIEKQRQLLALQAQLEGMKAENSSRQKLGQSLAYSEDAFAEMEDRILAVAR